MFASWLFGEFWVRVSWSMQWSLWELQLSQSEQSLSPHSKFSTNICTGTTNPLLQTPLLLLLSSCMLAACWEPEQDVQTQNRHPSLGAEKRDDKSLSESLRVRGGGRARPTVSHVHLHLCLQLGPFFIHISIWRRHQWLKPLVPALIRHHRQADSHRCLRREFTVRIGVRTLWPLWEVEEGADVWEEMKHRGNPILGDGAPPRWQSRG